MFFSCPYFKQFINDNFFRYIFFLSKWMIRNKFLIRTNEETEISDMLQKIWKGYLFFFCCLFVCLLFFF